MAPMIVLSSAVMESLTAIEKSGPGPASIQQSDGSILFSEPYSLVPLVSGVRVGAVALGCIGFFSLIALLVLLIIMGVRFSQATRVRLQDQCFLSVFGLFCADVFQAFAFTVSLYWVSVNGIRAPSTACTLQGITLNLGDVGSGLFNLLIAVQTVYSVLRGRAMPQWLFRSLAAFVVLFTFGLTFGGWALPGAWNKYWTRAGNWCWISDEYELARLLFHYLWVFTVQGSTVCLYFGLFIHLRLKVRRVGRSHTPAEREQQERNMRGIKRTISYLILYPVAYIATTLPLAIGRMRILSGHAVSDGYLVVAGGFLVSGGWVDVLIYSTSRSILRRVVLPSQPQLTAPTQSPAPGIPLPALAVPTPSHPPAHPGVGASVPGSGQPVAVDAPVAPTTAWFPSPLQPRTRLPPSPPPPAHRAAAPPPASSLYSSSAQSQEFGHARSSDEDLINARDWPTHAHGIPLTNLSPIPQGQVSQPRARSSSPTPVYVSTGTGRRALRRIYQNSEGVFTLSSVSVDSNGRIRAAPATENPVEPRRIA